MVDNTTHREHDLPEGARRVFEGVLFDVYQWDQEMYDGSKRVFEKLVRRDSSVIVPILEDGRVLLIEDEQPARGKHLTFPGGVLDEGEVPEAGARRELLEETGYEPGVVESLFDVDPWSKIDWRIHYFLGRNCKKISEPLVQAGEKITLRPVSFEEFVELASTGQMDTEPAFGMMALRAKADPEKMKELKKKFGVS